MTRRWRLLGPRLSQALLVAFVLAQSVIAHGACAVPMIAPSMAYAAEMPAPCDVPKNVCLARYLQADQIIDPGASCVASCESAVPFAALPDAAIAHPSVAVRRLATPPSTAPPPHILLCRMLN